MVWKRSKKLKIPPSVIISVNVALIALLVLLAVCLLGYRTPLIPEFITTKILAVAILAATLVAGVSLLLTVIVSRHLRQQQGLATLMDDIAQTDNDDAVLDIIGPCAVGTGTSTTNRGWNRLLQTIDKLRLEKERACSNELLSQNHTKNDALRSSNILDALSDGILLLDSSGVIVYGNRPAEGKFGSKLEGLMGKTLMEIVPDESFQSRFSDFLENRVKSNEITLDLTLAHQAPLPVDVNHDQTDNADDADKTDNLDNSDRQAPTSHHTDTNTDADDTADAATISTTVEDATILRFICRRFTNDQESHDIVIIVRDVTQQMLSENARDDFIAHVSHEFRSPLTNIRAYAETLLSEMVLDAATQKEAFNVINDETNRLTRLVNEVLDLTRLESGSLILDKGEVMLDRLIRQCVSDVSAMATGKRITLQTNYHPKLPNLYADREKLNVVVNNLLTNAIKYTPEDGTVFVETTCDERYVYFKVSDTGIGIETKDLARVFDKFYRVDRQETSTITGTGLGLATTKEIITLHSGTITVQSELNKGTTFMVKLPITQSGPTLGPAIGQ